LSPFFRDNPSAGITGIRRGEGSGALRNSSGIKLIESATFGNLSLAYNASDVFALDIVGGKTKPSTGNI